MAKLTVNRALPAGTVVHDRYRIEKVLGAGGFGVTYQVTDLKEGAPAALKEYMPADFAVRRAFSCTVQPNSGQEAPYEKFLEKFLQEAQTIYKFKGHPSIVEVRHLFRENGTAYYVMELLDGEDLGKGLARHGGRMPWDCMIPIFLPVAMTLETIHKAGLIHCDISPDNICMQRSGVPKLLDFGAARVLLHGEAVASVIVLKNGYAPPEQRFGRKMGTWTDVYALAATVYRCVTGRVPPAAEERLNGEAVIPPSLLGVEIPSPGWEQALMKGLALRMEERYQTAMEFWEALVADFAEVSIAELPMMGIQCIEGVRARASVQVTEELLVGVNAQKCGFAYPKGTPGVSRVHLRFWADGGRLMVMDMGSTYGSWINGRKMRPGLVYELNEEDRLRIGVNEVFVKKAGYGLYRKSEYRDTITSDNHTSL